MLWKRFKVKEKINAHKSKLKKRLIRMKVNTISVNTSVHFLSDKNSCVLRTGQHAAPVVTLCFSLTHVTCMALYHTVVIRYSTSVT